MTDQNAVEFTVKGVLRESFALFFSKSKNFFVFASVPFFISVVQMSVNAFLSREFVLWNTAVLMCWLLTCGFIIFFSKTSFTKHLRALIIHVFFRQSALQLLSLLRKRRYLSDILKFLFIFATLPLFFYVAARIGFIFQLRGFYSQSLMEPILGPAVALACWLLVCGFVLFFNKNPVIKNLIILASVLFLVSIVYRFVFFFFYYGNLRMSDSEMNFLIAIVGNVGYWLRWMLSYGFVACAVWQILSCGALSFSESLSRIVRRLPWLLLAVAVFSPITSAVGFMVSKLLEPLFEPLLKPLLEASSFIVAHFLWCIMVIPLLLCVCPLWLAVPVCVVENTEMKSLNRSVALTRGHYWAVFILLVIVWLSHDIILNMNAWVVHWVFNWLIKALRIGTFSELRDAYFHWWLAPSSLLMSVVVTTFGYIVGAFLDV